ncbi:MAG: hypothetical protein J6L72_12150, partial [Butyricicoccus sp.]|nr:hypothetical protein [Butyricicoccus sp.]
ISQMLALAVPERLAAVAPCSGVFFGGAEKRMLAHDCMKTGRTARRQQTAAGTTVSLVTRAYRWFGLLPYMGRGV